MTRLTRRGVAAVAVDRRRGEPPRVVSDLSENARIVRDTVDAVGAPVVLVGHSAGGPIITEAAAGHPSVRRLVYIAARMPAGEGDPLAYATTRSPSPPAHVTLADGSNVIDPAAAARRYYGDCDPATQQWATAQLVPQESPYDRRRWPEAVAWRELPSTYAVCAQDRALAPEYQREVARRATDVVEWNTSHSPFLSWPELVADLLERLAREDA